MGVQAGGIAKQKARSEYLDKGFSEKLAIFAEQFPVLMLNEIRFASEGQSHSKVTAEYVVDVEVNENDLVWFGYETYKLQRFISRYIDGFMNQVKERGFFFIDYSIEEIEQGMKPWFGTNIPFARFRMTIRYQS